VADCHKVYTYRYTLKRCFWIYSVQQAPYKISLNSADPFPKIDNWKRNVGFQEVVLYSGVKICNSLQSVILECKNDKSQFKKHLKRFLVVDSFYSLAEFFTHSQNYFVYTKLEYPSANSSTQTKQSIIHDNVPKREFKPIYV
jgi:hypothetical protein